jgi:hypothetical protein
MNSDMICAKITFVFHRFKSWLIEVRERKIWAHSGFGEHLMVLL